MRYYIDVGAYNGDLLKKVINCFPPFYKYICFEPVPQLCEKISNKFKYNDKVFVINKAVSTVNQEKIKFYICYCKEEGGYEGKGTEIGTGSTLFEKKETANIDKNIFLYISTINFSQYIIDSFEKDDYIILKMDVEGKEYDILEHMIETGAIKYVNKLYCEWHVSKFKKYKKINRNRHNKLIKRLQKRGLSITGKNDHDDLSYLIESNKI